jgi:hypothetical protein
MRSKSTNHHVLSCLQMDSAATSIVRLSLAIGLLIAATGCGGGDELNRVEVHGEVTLNGAPVQAGRVNFIPEEGTHGPASGSEIAMGKFAIIRDRGPIPGKYLVRIQVNDAESVDDADTAVAITFRPRTKTEVLEGKDELQAEGSRPYAGTPGSRSGKLRQNTAPEFHVTVTAEGPNNFELAVGSEGADDDSVPRQDGKTAGNE